MSFIGFLRHCEYKPQLTISGPGRNNNSEERGVVCKLQNNLIQDMNFQEQTQNVEHISKDL